MAEPTMTADELDAAIEGQVVGQWLIDNVRDHGDEVALRWRDGSPGSGTRGVATWGEMTWAQVATQASQVAARFTEWGVGAGDAVGLFLLNRPEFHPVDLGGLLCRARSVSIYNSSSTEQVSYLLGHMEAKVVVCDSIEFLQRVLAVRAELPLLEHIIIVEDPDGQRPDDVTLLADLLTGDGVDLQAAVDASQADDIVTLIYTSGTTGTPKGVMLDHRNIAASAISTFSLVGDETQGLRGLSYLPMAHIAERMVSHYGWLFQRNIVTCVPDPTTLATYLAPVKPQSLFGPPRVFEKLRSAVLAGVTAKGEEAAAQFDQALALGQTVAAMTAAGQDVPADLAQKHAQVDAAAFAPVRAMLGLDEMQYAFSGAAPLPTHVFDFFRGIGVPFSEIYGMSENTGGMTWDPFAVKQGTVGRPIPGTEVILAEDGEVLCRGAIVSRGYFKDPERTADTFDDDGWLHTGDIGTYDEDGYLSIVDRKKELIITAAGKNVSPANIEAELKGLPMIGQACVIGDDRPYLTALLVLDPDTAPGWAQSQGIEGATLDELAEAPELLAAVETGVADVLAKFNNVERIKKWTVLGDDWLPDSEQLTATMKLKRRGVHAVYADQIEAMYQA